MGLCTGPGLSLEDGVCKMANAGVGPGLHLVDGEPDDAGGAAGEGCLTCDEANGVRDDGHGACVAGRRGALFNNSKSVGPGHYGHLNSLCLNDSITAVKVDAGCRVRLFADSNGTGPCANVVSNSELGSGVENSFPGDAGDVCVFFR
jgi:hypothetical protein